MLSDRCDAGRQATGQPDQHIFDRWCAPVLGRESQGVVGIEIEHGGARLLLAEAEETLNG